jgi:hypothetical protein
MELACQTTQSLGQPNLSSIVTLNLFLGPFLRATGVPICQQTEGLGAFPAGSALAAQWAFKQVQGDEKGEDFSNTITPTQSHQTKMAAPNEERPFR